MSRCGKRRTSLFTKKSNFQIATTILGLLESGLGCLFPTPDPAIGTIGLVPCAVGNTYISQWSKGRLLTRARASLRDGEALRAMLWYQGENDASNLEDAKLYKIRLEAFFNDLRTDLMAPSLPIIQVGLASGGNSSVIREMIREAHLKSSAGLHVGERLPPIFSLNVY